MDYRDKLNRFNSTHKYFSEVNFLKQLLGGGSKIVLDYGCGTGWTSDHLNVWTEHRVLGYDVEKHNPEFSYQTAFGSYEVVFFMHSFAHIKNVGTALRALSTNQIIIITPNRDWLNIQNKEGYIPDPTVYEHYTTKTLRKVVEMSGFEIVMNGQFGKSTNNQNERLFLIANKIQNETSGNIHGI